MRNSFRRLFVLGSTIVALACISFVLADTEIPPDPSPPDLIAEHAGATVFHWSENEQVISGSTLNAVNGMWNIQTSKWTSDVPASRAVWALFSIALIYDETGEFPIGIQVLDYALTKHALSGSATTTNTAVFDLPPLGHVNTPSGIYSIVVAELPENKLVFDPVLGDMVEEPYADQDFVNWFAGTGSEDEIIEPIKSRFLEFRYEAGEAVIAPNTPDPVIIIPGILGSAQHNGEWLIDPITHAYDNLIDTLVANGYEKGVTLFPFPYEWRFSNRTTATLLDAKIDEIKDVCGCDKVDIVAHSMGGLVARSYIQSDDYDQDVDQLIFLGTPHLGAPKAYLMWEGGQNDVDRADQRIRMFLRIEAIKHGFTDLFDYIRAIPIPSVQELLPVYGYIKHVGSPIIPSYPNASWYPNNLFLHDLNASISELYNSGVTISNFTGQLTASTTITTIRVIAPTTTSPTLKWGFGYPDGFLNQSGDRGLERGLGDRTVPLFSASSIIEGLQIFDSDHGELPTAAESAIFEKLTGNEPLTLVTDRDRLDVPMLIFQILSPADFVVEAPNGLKMGKDFATGQEFTQIPDAFYSGFGTDDEYVTIPNPLNGLYKVVTQGTGTGGAFTIAAGLITEATSSEKFFTGQTLPGLLTTFHVDVGLNGPSAAIKDIQIVATVGSTQLDIKRAYALGWLKSSTIRDSLLLLLTQAQKFKKQSDKIKLYNAMLKILKAAKKTGLVNQQGYDLLTADINWLMTH